MPGTNAASRVHLHVVKAMSRAPQRSVIDAMMETFDIKVVKEADKPRAVSKCIELFLSQVDLVEDALTVKQVPSDLWSRAITCVRNAFNQQMLGNQWQGVMGSLTPDVPIALNWAAYHLPSDDEATSAETEAEIQALLSDISDLENAAKNVDLPESLKRFLGENLSAMRDALRMYGITGLGPLKEAVRRAAGDLALRSNEINTACKEVNAESHGFVRRAFGTLRKGAEVARETADTIESMEKLIGYAAPIVKSALTVVSGGGG